MTSWSVIGLIDQSHDCNWSVTGLLVGLISLFCQSHDFNLCMFSGKYPMINDDLVNSHHLLLCCLDMIYSAAYTKRPDLLNPECPVSQNNLEDRDGEELSLLGQLCQAYNG